MKSAAILAGALAAGLLQPGAPPARAAAAAAQTLVLQGPALYRFAVGDVPVTALTDGTVPQDLLKLLRSASAQQIESLLARAFLGTPLEVSINAFLLKLDGRLVLVDTGAGQVFGQGRGGLLVQSLALAGVEPEAITDILLTHVHGDHTGGLVADGRMVFPNATVHVGKQDLDFFTDESNAQKTGYALSYFQTAAKTLKPYVDAGRVETFDRTARILPGITVEPEPGHTPGSAFYTLSDHGQRLIFVGDLVHVTPVQFLMPGVTIAYDEDQAAAKRRRIEQFARLAHDRALIAVPHMPFPGLGHVRAAGEGCEWVPVNYVNRAPQAE